MIVQFFFFNFLKFEIIFPLHARNKFTNVGVLKDVFLLFSQACNHFSLSVFPERLSRRQTASVECPREEGPPMERDRRTVQTHHSSQLHTGKDIPKSCSYNSGRY